MTDELQGRAPLGAFGLYLVPPTWIGKTPDKSEREAVAWHGVSSGGVPVQARHDGFIVFEFDKSTGYAGGAVPEAVIGPDRKIPREYAKSERERIALAYKRLDYMNAFLMALYSASSTIEKRGLSVQRPVTPTTYFAADLENGKWVFRQEFERNFKYPDQRSVMTFAAIEHAIDVMGHCENRFGEGYLDILKLTYLASRHYASHQFDSAHILAWTVVEKLINVIWTDYLNAADTESGGPTKLNKERRKTLTGRDYTASVMTQTLSLAGKLDDDLLNRMDNARRKRNSFAHSLEAIAENDATGVIQIATDLITKLSGIRITSQLSLSYFI